jgi:predicted nuclease with TOPRIM domain
MNPDHADHDTNDMPRAVEHALRAHNAMDDELCRTVAGEVWQDMQQAYDDIYGMWQEELRVTRELERERDEMRAAYEHNALAAMGFRDELARVKQERERFRAALEKITSDPYDFRDFCGIARNALEGKP